MKKKFFAVVLAASMVLPMPIGGGVTANAETVPNPLYFFDFEAGLDSTGTETGTAQIVGSGQIEKDTIDVKNFGKVYHNDPELKKQIRTNYLQLPDIMDKVIDAGKNEMTVSFWVNKANAADFWFSPIFSMYEKQATENGDPMLVLQTRKVMQINCAGWCDFTNDDNDQKTNSEDTFWLDDGGWHYYTMTITEKNAKVYIDGKVVNSWTVDGTDGHMIAGIFSDAAKDRLNYVCLGGNQAWNWGDPDPAFCFDDVAIYGEALTEEQIQAVMAAKTAGPEVYVQKKEEVDGEYTIRVVAKVTLDGLADTYVGAGFRCTKQRSSMVNAVNNIAEMYLSNVVFKSITAGREVITAEGENEYFVVTQVTDVPKNGVLYVKPMYTKSGTSAEAFVDKIYTINMSDILAQN